MKPEHAALCAKLLDLHNQATVERSHYYTGTCVRAALEAIESLSAELASARNLIDESGNLSDWINRARPVMLDLMAAYERRIRTDCTAEQLALQPWRCAEFVAAERLLAAQPVWYVVVDAAIAREQGET